MYSDRKPVSRVKVEKPRLTPIHTKYFSPPHGKELPGWRSSSPSFDRGLKVTVQSPSCVTSRGVLNSSPRYPISELERCSSTIPALPNVARGGILKVQLKPRLSRMELDLDVVQAEAEKLRLPSVRASVDHSNARHEHLGTGNCPELSTCLNAQSLSKRLSRFVPIADGDSFSIYGGNTSDRKPSKYGFALDIPGGPALSEAKSAPELYAKKLRRRRKDLGEESAGAENEAYEYYYDEGSEASRNDSDELAAADVRHNRKKANKRRKTRKHVNHGESAVSESANSQNLQQKSAKTKRKTGHDSDSLSPNDSDFSKHSSDDSLSGDSDRSKSDSESESSEGAALGVREAGATQASPKGKSDAARSRKQESGAFLSESPRSKRKRAKTRKTSKKALINVKLPRSKTESFATKPIKSIAVSKAKTDLKKIAKLQEEPGLEESDQKEPTPEPIPDATETSIPRPASNPTGPLPLIEGGDSTSQSITAGEIAATPGKSRKKREHKRKRLGKVKFSEASEEAKDGQSPVQDGRHGRKSKAAGNKGKKHSKKTKKHGKGHSVKPFELPPDDPRTIDERSEHSDTSRHSSDFSSDSSDRLEAIDLVAETPGIDHQAIVMLRRKSEDPSKIAIRSRKMTLNTENANELSRISIRTDDSQHARMRRASAAVDETSIPKFSDGRKGKKKKRKGSKEKKTDSDESVSSEPKAILEENADDSVPLISSSSISEASDLPRPPPKPKPVLLQPPKSPVKLTVVVRPASRHPTNLPEQPSKAKVTFRTRNIEGATYETSYSSFNPLDIFINNLSYSLLLMINDVLEIADAVNEESFFDDIKPMKRGGKKDQSLAEAMKRAKMRSYSSKLAVPAQMRRSRRSVTESAASNARQMLNRIKTLSKRKAAEKKPTTTPLTPIAVTPSSSEIDSESLFSSESEEQHELEKLQMQQYRMADYELKHLSMLKKIAIDLLKGADSMSPPLNQERDEAPANNLYSSSEDDERPHYEEYTHRPAREVRFVSNGDELGQEVGQALGSMFENYQPSKTDIFMPEVSMKLAEKVERLSEDTREIPDKVEIDYENLRSAMLRRRFRNQMELQPDYDIFLAMQNDVLVQAEHSKAIPTEMRMFFKNVYLKKKRRREVTRLREGKEHVTLRALPTFTFTNLDTRTLSKRLATTEKRRMVSPPIPSPRPSTESLEGEKVYFRLRGAADRSFGKTPRGVDANLLSKVVEELAEVSHRT